jgi:heptosyltransferase II
MKILIVKIGALGDVLMARDMARLAKDTNPEAEVTWLCGQSVAAMVRLFDGVDQIITIDDKALLASGKVAALGQLARIATSLAFRYYDLIATGHFDWRYRFLSRTAIAGTRRSFVRGSLPRPGRFHGDEYARLIRGMDVPGLGRIEPKPLKVTLEPALRRKIAGEGKALLLFPGGAKNLLRDDALRRWPLEHYAALAKLAKMNGWRIWLGGAESDAWTRSAFAGLGVLDLIGAADLPQTLALSAAASAVVTHDSGPLHLAAAAGARVIALFGPTAPSEKVNREEDVSVLWGGELLACRPCYDGRNYAACDNNVCLGRLTPGEVMAALSQADAR